MLMQVVCGQAGLIVLFFTITACAGVDLRRFFQGGVFKCQRKQQKQKDGHTGTGGDQDLQHVFFLGCKTAA
jgi:hypothetical protein